MHFLNVLKRGSCESENSVAATEFSGFLQRAIGLILELIAKERARARDVLNKFNLRCGWEG